MPRRGAPIQVRHRQHGRLLEGASNELQANRKAVVGEAARHGDRRYAEQVRPPQLFRAPALEALASVPQFWGVFWLAVHTGVFYTLSGLSLFVMLRLVMRRQGPAMLTLIVFAIVLNAGSASPSALAEAAPITLLGFAVLLRVGALANITMAVVRTLPLTLDPAAWYFGRSLALMLLVLVAATWSCAIALGQRGETAELARG